MSRQAKYNAKKRREAAEQGLKERRFYCNPDDRERIQRYIDKLNKQRAKGKEGRVMIEFKFSEPNKCDACGYDELTARILDKNICSDCHTEWETFTSEHVDYQDND